MEYSKKEGLTKLRSDDNYIPISVCIDPVLYTQKALKADQLSIDCTTDFKDVVTDCRKKLAALVCQQAHRNHKDLEKQHRHDMLKKMLKMWSAMTGHLKVKLGEQESTANKDVIAKAALLNLFHHGFDMVERFHDDEDEDEDKWTRNSKRNPVASILFNGDIKSEDVWKLLSEVVELGIDGGIKKWEPLLFSNHKKFRRDKLVRSYLESKQLPPAPTTTAVLAASTEDVALVMPNNNNNNNNINHTVDDTMGATSNENSHPPPTGVTPQPPIQMTNFVGSLFRLMPDGSFMPFVPTPTIVDSIIKPKKKLKPLDQ